MDEGQIAGLRPGVLHTSSAQSSCEVEAPGELRALRQANYISIFEGVAWVAISFTKPL